MKIILLNFLLLTSAIGFTQFNNSENIISVYGIEWFNTTSQNNPDIIVLLDKFVDYGLIVEVVSSDKSFGLEVLSTIPLREKSDGVISISQFMDEYNSSSFNPLRYDFFPTNEMQSYKLEGLDIVIHIMSQETILDK